jgi:hypothetical protein
MHNFSCVLSLTFSALSLDEYKQRQMSVFVMSSDVSINSSQSEIMLYIIVWEDENYTFLERVLPYLMGSKIL